MRPTKSTVGIVTPTFNQASFVEESIRSILAQDYQSIQYVVVNDGSTDRTHEIVSQLEGGFEYVNQPNRGQSRTLNEQWSLMSTDYLAYLSSDDLLDRNLISKAVGILDTTPDVVCVYPDARLIDQNGHTIKRAVCRPFSLEEFVIGQECSIGPGAVFRRSAFSAVGGWRSDLRLAPDREFWIRISRAGRFEFIPEQLASYRLHVGSYSVRETSLEQSLEYVRVLDDYFASDSPAEIACKKNEAYANAYFLAARNSFRRGAFFEGLDLLVRAGKYDSRIWRPRRLSQLARNVVSKPIRLATAKIRSAR